MPDGEDGVEDEEGRDGGEERPGHPAEGADSEQGAEHPARRPQEEGGRDDDGEQEVLHHGGGEEVALAQDVQGGEEGEGGGQDGPVEGRHLPPAEVAGALRAEGPRRLPAGGRAPEAEETGPEGPGGQG